MIYDIRSPYFQRLLIKRGLSSKEKETNVMLSKMLSNMKVVNSIPVNATSA